MEYWDGQIEQVGKKAAEYFSVGRLPEVQRKAWAKINHDNPELITEIKLKTKNQMERQILLIICHAYKLKPYRVKGENLNHFYVKSTMPFVDEIIWKDFEAYVDLFDPILQQLSNHWINIVHNIYTNNDDKII